MHLHERLMCGDGDGEGTTGPVDDGPTCPPRSHRVILWMPTGGAAHDGAMTDDRMGYEVVLSDGRSELVLATDGYQQEGPLTTFFRGEAGRPVLDSWSVRVASYRTSDITRIRRVEVVAAAEAA